MALQLQTHYTFKNGSSRYGCYAKILNFSVKRNCPTPVLTMSVGMYWSSETLDCEPEHITYKVPFNCSDNVSLSSLYNWLKTQPTFENAVDV